MFYVLKGELHLSASARLYPEVKAVEDRYKGNDKLLMDVLTYVRFCYVKHDNEDYWNMPPMTRCRHVVRAFKLFGIKEKAKDKDVDGVIAGMEKEESIAGLIRLCKDTLLTDKGRIVEDLRRKVEALRAEYMDERDYDTIEKIYKALTHAQGLLEKYEASSGTTDNIGMMYLFELPEGAKPYHLKITTS